MAEPAPWEITIRVETAHALSRKECPRARGWALTEHRGFARLNITAKAGGGKRRQRQLPIPWRFDHAKKIGEAVCRIYDDVSNGIEPGQAAKKVAFTSSEQSDNGSSTAKGTSPEQQIDWNALIAPYREYKIRSGDIKESTWTRMHRHHMMLVLEAFATRQPPRSAPQLLDRLTLHWADTADSDAGLLGAAPLGGSQGHLPATQWEPPPWRWATSWRWCKLCPTRDGYAHRAHVICDLAAYSRWCGDDVVDDAFAKAEQRLLAS